MFKRILALIWLRTQVLLTNKNTLVQVVFPFFMVLLFQNFYEYRWHSRENTIV